MPTYRMRMRVVRGAPHFDTIEHPEMVQVDATNARSAESIAAARVARQYPGASVIYATSKRRV